MTIAFIRSAAMACAHAVFALCAVVRPLAAQIGVVGATRWDANHYIEYVIGNAPIILTACHGGDLRPPTIADRTYGTTGQDVRVLELAREAADQFAARFGRRPHLVLVHLHRIKLDANRDIVEGAQGDPIAAQAWTDFHRAVADARNTVLATWGCGFYIDLHGHGHPEGWVELGYGLSSADLNLADNVLAQSIYVDASSLRSAASQPGVWFPDLLRGADSLGGALQIHGYDAVPGPVFPSPAGGNYFDGGYNVRTYGSGNGTPVDGVQIESPGSVRGNVQVRAAFLQQVGLWLQGYFPRWRGLDPSLGASVTVTASDRIASERGGPAAFTLHRRGSTAAPLMQWFQLQGTATAGVDYQGPGSSATFPPGAASVQVPIVPLDDVLAEGDETITLRLLGINELGVPSHAEVVLFDDEVAGDVALQVALDEGAGTLAHDTSPHARLGTLLPAGAGPNWVAGRHGTALHFDGVDDRVRFADFAYAPAGEFSLSFWFRCGATGGTGFKYMVSHGGVSSSNRLGIYFDQSNGTLRTALIYANDLTAIDVLDVTRDLRDGSWHHYALVARTADLVRVYIDGRPETAAMYLGDRLDPAGDLTLGARSDLGSSNFAAIDLDDLRLYHRALGEAEVALQHDGGGAEAMLYPGSGEDLELATGVNGMASVGPGADVKYASAGNLLVARYASPGSGFAGGLGVLLGELFVTGAPPTNGIFPELHLAAGFALLHGPVLLSAGGANWTVTVPPAVPIGLSLMLQPLALSGSARNGVFAAADAHEIRLQ